MNKKERITSSIAVGEAMALRTLKRRQQARTTRATALAKIKPPTSKSAAAAPQTRALAPTHSAGVLLAEGDSWFDYPLHDVLSDLEDLHGFEVESVAHKGDTVEGMAYSDGQLDDFSRLVEKVLRRNGPKPRAILLSGGGNDVAGDEFALLLNHAMSTNAGLNASILSGVVDERVHDAFVTILSAITAVCTKLIGDTVPIVVHGYDYPVADGRGFLGGWGPLPGPWLEPGFRSKGYGPGKVRHEICVELIDRFNDMLGQLAGKGPFAHVRYLDLRCTLSTGKKFKDDWANELHPSREGFKKVAKKFAATV